MKKLEISPQRNSRNISPLNSPSPIKKKYPNQPSHQKSTPINKAIPSKTNIPISSFYYINKNSITLSSLKNGRRIFHNKTELSSYDSSNPSFNQRFIEFRQLFFENLLLNEDFTENLKEKLSIQSALFSTFVYDAEFIEPLINTFKLKSIIVRHRDDVKYNQMEEKENFIKFVFPKADYTLRWGKFHSKLMLLKFPTFLRVVVPSANLTNGDWYYWGQIIWLQDFPLKAPSKDEDDTEGDDNDFAQYLNVFLKEFMPNAYEGKRFWTELGINLFAYEYSACPIDLVASSNGRFKGKERFQFGMGRLIDLMEFYKEKRPSLEASNSLIVQCSSIGKGLKGKFLVDFKKAFNVSNECTMSIIYPSEEYIGSFPLGKELSSCLFLTLDVYQLHKAHFKVIELKKEHETRKTVFHSKCFITCRKEAKSKAEDKVMSGEITDDSILYFGSHNFSVAAWGSFEKGDSQIAIANYELGIIFNPIKVTFEEKKAIYESMILNMNSRRYDENDYPFINDFSS